MPSTRWPPACIAPPFGLPLLLPGPPSSGSFSGSRPSPSAARTVGSSTQGKHSPSAAEEAAGGAGGGRIECWAGHIAHGVAGLAEQSRLQACQETATGSNACEAVRSAVRSDSDCAASSSAAAAAHRRWRRCRRYSACSTAWPATRCMAGSPPSLQIQGLPPRPPGPSPERMGRGRCAAPPCCFAVKPSHALRRRCCWLHFLRMHP